MSEPKPTKLAPPDSSPLVPGGGSKDRGRPIFSENGGAGEREWEVTVTPLEGAKSLGKPLGADAPPSNVIARAVDLADRSRPRATFEVRAHFRGPGGSAFGRRPGVIRSPTIWVRDQELALAMARLFAERLQRGEREFGDDPMGEIELEVKGRA